MEFTTEIKTQDIYLGADVLLCKHLDIDKSTDISDKNATATIKWHIDIETREWGVKGISIFIDDVSISGEVEYYDIEDVECEDKIYKEFNCEGFKLINEMEIDGDFICPSDVDVDFSKKTITIK